jgi:hypothetical protein
MIALPRPDKQRWVEAGIQRAFVFFPEYRQQRTRNGLSVHVSTLHWTCSMEDDTPSFEPVVHWHEYGSGGTNPDATSIKVVYDKGSKESASTVARLYAELVRAQNRYVPEREVVLECIED